MKKNETTDMSHCFIITFSVYNFKLDNSGQAGIPSVKSQDDHIPFF